MKRFPALSAMIGILIIVCCLSACVGQNEESGTVISVNPKAANSLTLSSLFSAVDTIPYPDDFASATKAIPYKGCLYLFAGSKILVLDNAGNQLSVIDHKGKGHGEYLTVQDFFVADSLLYLNDSETKTMLVYNLSGAFHHSFKHNLLSNNFLVKDGKVYLDCGNLPNADNPYMVNVFDAASGKLLNSICEKKTSDTYLSVLEVTNFATVGDDIMYSSTFSPVIYRIDGDRFVPEWRIDFGPYSLPNAFSDGYKDLMNYMMAIRDGGYATRMDCYHETESKLFFMYSIGEERPFVLYDKKTGNLLHFNQIIDDMSSGEAHTVKTSYQILPLYMDDEIVYVMAKDKESNDTAILAFHFKD